MNRLEIAGAREFGEANFQCVFIQWASLAQRNAAAYETIVEFVQALELDVADDVRRRIAEGQLEAHGVFHGLKEGIGVYGLKERCARFGIARLQVHGVKAAERVHFLLGEDMVPARDWKRQRPSRCLLKSGAGFDGCKTVERARLHRDEEREARLCGTAREREPFARSLRDFVHASAAYSCLGISVILVVR